MMIKRIGAGAIAAVIPLAFLSGCNQAASSDRPATPVTMAYCGGGQHARPALISVICASDAITARNLAWSAWGKPVATAIGVAVVDVCAFEDCHTGSYNPFSIVLIASKIVSCPKRIRAYSRLQFVFVGRSPFQDLPAHMNFSNFMFGSGRPGMPRNQTINLAC